MTKKHDWPKYRLKPYKHIGSANDTIVYRQGNGIIRRRSAARGRSLYYRIPRRRVLIGQRRQVYRVRRGNGTIVRRLSDSDQDATLIDIRPPQSEED